MTRDNEIPAIFNPRRVRAPSVVVTGDSPNGSFAGGGFTNILHSSNPQIATPNLLAQSDAENPPSTPNQVTSTTVNATTALLPAQTVTTPVTTVTNDTDNPQSRWTLAKCKESCCAETAQKIYFGICVTILITASWVGATHCIKFLYIRRNISEYTASTASLSTSASASIISSNDNFFFEDFENDTNDLFQTIQLPASVAAVSTGSLSRSAAGKATTPVIAPNSYVYNAPFFTAWFCTNFALLFFPIYLIGRLAISNCNESPGEILGNIVRGFRDRGFTAARFLNRCILFCLLWLLTTYLYILSLQNLLATHVMALFATNVACAYLLSWVILHEQFVGIRIVAVILCDTGIALLAYMDGITGSPTLGGVVLAVLSAAGYAVFKVMFRKIMGDPPVPMVAFTFTMLGLINVTLCWPITLGLYLYGSEEMPWENLTWIVLLIACILMLVFHILSQFSSAVTYSVFVTLGLITSVPVSAALDTLLYGANFVGMKLAGIILIAIGFFMVMLPNNWPDYITHSLRKTVRAFLRYQCCCEYDENEYIHSRHHLTGPSREVGERYSKRLSFCTSPYRHRLSDGLHPFTSTFSLRPCEMTESLSQGFTTGDHQGHHYQMIDRDENNQNNQFHRSYMTTVIMTDDDYVATTPTARTRRASVFEESFLSASNFIKRKFSFGSSE